MTFGFTLVLALCIYAPGFAAYAGLFLGSQSRNFRPAPPAPGSLLAVGLVTAGAIASHAAAATLFFLNEKLVAAGLAILPFGPSNPYLALIAAARAPTALTSAELASILLGLVGLGIATLLVSARLVRTEAFQRRFAPLLYGWLTDLVRAAASENRVVTAFVLSEIEHEGNFLGYEGVIDTLTLSADKEVIGILLLDCTRFRLQLTGSGLARDVARASSVIPRLYLERAQIKNIAFNIYERQPAEAIASAIASGTAVATAGRRRRTST